MSDLGFLRDSLQRQRKVAEHALAEAKRIDALLQKPENAEAKEELEKAKAAFISIARDLAANATQTSTAATVTVLNSTVTVKK